ncbi:sulfate/molybdate ABC transporter ATP-binding protein [Nocardia rhizosphaerihabitans]|uniref:Molybdenum ABC transporter ATP-binding protein n=1 Tax=Nocardia rhizosphaerihabitans TaxID=1691570 RepID=A0ABQ2KP66_9NOCA|nr:ATP-binding cassette domain-containing protein [Nocardia rhizosphaerihabitans]GGN88126.1 molybdenum ABC transporter ATP-binding protein [Nocardia rhizosphaerihabitans]
MTGTDAPQHAGLSVAARIADRDLDVRIEVAPGEVLAVLGPNGAGKSSLLQVIAGLIVPDEGHVRLGDRTLTEIAKGIALPPHRRGISLLAQDPLLFPHLSVRDNVAFGPRSRGARNRAAQSIATDWLAAVDAVTLADRHPGALSGGQAQRVALARALAVDPDLLLLDEPMSALDVDVAPAMRTLLRRVLRDEPGRAHPRCAVLVTHDIIDAITLADRIVVLEAGRIAESGPVTDVMSHPRSPFAARIAGLNLLHGTGIEAAAPVPSESPPRPSDQVEHRPGLADQVEHAGGLAERVEHAPDRAGQVEHAPGRRAERAPWPSAAGGRVDAPVAAQAFGAVRIDGLRVDGCVVGDFVPGTDAAAVFSPAAVSVFTERPVGSPRNVFAVEIVDITDHGGIVRVRGDAPQADLSADLTPAAVAQLGLAVGAEVFFAVKATEVRVYAC